MAPRNIAEIIVKHINLETHPTLHKIDIAGAGFINIHLSDEWLYDTLRTIASMQSEYGTCDEGAGKSLQIEFVSANPTGPLNIVSGRAAAVGDTLVNLLNAIGYKAIREFYVNDAGGQVERLGASMMSVIDKYSVKRTWKSQKGGIRENISENSRRRLLKLKVISFFNLRRTSELPASVIRYRPHLGTAEASLERFGVSFDVWSSEKAIRDSGKPEEIIELFREKAYLYEAEGATWFRMTDFGDDKDCVVIRSNGEYTYFVPDAAYHAISLTGDSRRLLICLDPTIKDILYGSKVLSKHSVYPMTGSKFLSFNRSTSLMLKASDWICQSGAGSSLHLTHLLMNLQKRREQFAVDVARYFFLMRANNTHLDFNMELAITHASENPVFYIQYAHARCCSIFEQGNEQGITPKPIEAVSLKQLTEPMEYELIRKLAEFPAVVLLSAEAREAHRVPHYLHELSGIFHPYYNQHRVLDPTDMKRRTHG